MAHVTDYDVWHISEEPVTVEKVIEILNRNTGIAQKVVRNMALSQAGLQRTCACGHALAEALITRPEVVQAETRHRLDLLVKKYLA